MSSDLAWNSGAESSSSEGGGGSAENSDQPIPEAPVDMWRSKLQSKTLISKDLIDFVKQAAPPLFLTESARNPADLGE